MKIVQIVITLRTRDFIISVYNLYVTACREQHIASSRYQISCRCFQAIFKSFNLGFSQIETNKCEQCMHINTHNFEKSQSIVRHTLFINSSTLSRTANILTQNKIFLRILWFFLLISRKIIRCQNSPVQHFSNQKKTCTYVLGVVDHSHNKTHIYSWSEGAAPKDGESIHTSILHQLLIMLMFLPNPLRWQLHRTKQKQIHVTLPSLIDEQVSWIDWCSDTIYL